MAGNFTTERKRAIFKAAWTIRRQDGKAMGEALRRAWAWMKAKLARLAGQAARKIAAPAAPTPRTARIERPAGRRVFSPLDRSPEAREYFADRARRYPGRGSGSWSVGV